MKCEFKAPQIVPDDVSNGESVFHVLHDLGSTRCVPYLLPLVLEAVRNEVLGLESVNVRVQEGSWAFVEYTVNRRYLPTGVRMTLLDAILEIKCHGHSPPKASYAEARMDHGFSSVCRAQQSDCSGIQLQDFP
jgi:hypothetical protein